MKFLGRVVADTSGVVTLVTEGAPSLAVEDGGLAVDVTNNVFYFRSNGAWQQVSGGGASVTVSDTPPPDPAQGDLWFESDTGDIYVWYDDGASGQWVDIGGSSVANMATTDDPPSNPVNGDLWFETDTGKTFVWYNDGSNAQWIEIGYASGAASGTDGSIQFSTGGSFDSSVNLYWDDTNSRLGINTTTPTTAVDVSGTVTATSFVGPLTGNADTATALETARDIELVGEVTGVASFDGTANIQITTTITPESQPLDELSDVAITSAQDGELLVHNGTEWVNTTLPTSEPMGHEDRTASTISFDPGTLTFSIAPVSGSYTVWCAGRRHVKTGTETVTIPNTAGLYYISFDATGTLQYELTFFTWHEDTPTAYVYWNGTDYLLFDERHGITLDWQTHEYLHRTRGAVLANGFGASNYTTTGDGTLDTDAQIDIANGTFFDEDLQVDIVHSATPTANTWEQILQGAAEIPVIYLSGTTWTFDTATEFPLKQGTLAKYNLNTAGTWSTPDLGNGAFGVTWIVATNILNSPVIGILGQGSYNNIGQAEAVEWSGLNLEGFPVVELRPLYKVVYETKTSYTNTPKAAIKGVYDLRRYGSVAGEIPALPVADHGTLTGLGDDDHPQYLLADGTRSATQLTVTGDLSVDSGTLFVDSTNNRVGIGTSSPPSDTLYVAGGIYSNFGIRTAGYVDAESYYINDSQKIRVTGGVLEINPTTVGDVSIGTSSYTNNLIVTGNLTVKGTSTTLETETLVVEDNIVVLNHGQASPVLDAGIEVERGSVTNSSFTWDETNDRWVFNDGTTTYIVARSSNDLTDMLTSSASANQFLVWDDGEQAWTPESLGGFVLPGTGVSITGSILTTGAVEVSIGQDVSTTADVEFDTVTATTGLITATSSGVPSATLADGALIVDTANDTIYIRSNGSWVQASGAGGASVTVSDDPPAGAETGDMWYESDTGRLLVFYDSVWIEVGGAGGGSYKLTSSSRDAALITMEIGP